MLLLIGLQALHVLCGVLWFGGAVYAHFVVIPASNRVDRGDVHGFSVPYQQFAKRFMMPVSTLTVLSGVGLGFPLQAWADLGRTYFGNAQPDPS